MKKIKQNNGFSLIELVIAIAVLAFLMLAVSSFMSSSVIQNKKAKADVRMQAQAQETYSLLTDSIMQATDILIIGYVANDDSLVDLTTAGKDGEETTAIMTKKYYVKDSTAATKLMEQYGEGIKDDIVYFKDANPKQKVYISEMQITSSVPLDLNYVPGANTSCELNTKQSIKNDITGEYDEITCVKASPAKVYDKNDTVISTFYFNGSNMYYGKKYTYMVGSATETGSPGSDPEPDLDDPMDITDSDSLAEHLYNKYFSYVVAKKGASTLDISGCVATIDGNDGTIGIDLYYNKSSMTYTTIGRVNPRNSYVLVPKK